MVDDTRVWVHGCDPGRVSDGSRLALYQTLNRVPFFYLFLACVFCYCSVLFVVSVLFRYVFLLFVFEFALVGALYKYVPLIFFCPADHVPDWQPRILLGTVEARSVNVKKTTTTTGTMYWLLLLLLLFLTFSVLVANPKKLLYTVANPARGLLNREKRTKEKVWQHTPPPPPPTLLVRRK